MRVESDYCWAFIGKHLPVQQIFVIYCVHSKLCLNNFWSLQSLVCYSCSLNLIHQLVTLKYIFNMCSSRLQECFHSWMWLKSSNVFQCKLAYRWVSREVNSEDLSLEDAKWRLVYTFSAPEITNGDLLSPIFSSNSKKRTPIARS